MLFFFHLAVVINSSQECITLGFLGSLSNLSPVFNQNNSEAQAEKKPFSSS